MLRPQFVLFGDSLTQQSFDPAGGWGASLADAYARKADVINRGYGGYNTRWALKMLTRIFPQTAEPPRLVTVFFGANDAAIPGRLGERQHVAIPDYVDNLRTIVQHLQQLRAGSILLITPPPVSDQGRVKYNCELQGVTEVTQIPERTNAFTGQYAEACKSLASELGLPVLDLWGLMQQERDWEAELFWDGLHFTSKGNAVVYKHLQALVDEQFPDLRAEDMAYDFPHHSKFDPANVDAAFQ
ncbi:hypothetical protein WJX72_001713 [[Myrmecia] bisecta]|uniref:SGNH hydrolase-type esterase domain-containing protein n=1 Tax=[Myrmecia] bisecta TaxID=41462 RepID=A0AAW1R4N4_9CHLO